MRVTYAEIYVRPLYHSIVQQRTNNGGFVSVELKEEIMKRKTTIMIGIMLAALICTG
jgi:hypothetical protein